MQHRTQSDLEQADFKSTASMFNGPEGLVFGFGTTVGNGIEGWAPGALFIDTDASAGAQMHINQGTKTTAAFKPVESTVRKSPSTKTADYTCVAADSGTHFDNVGASGAVTFTLPAVTNTGWEAWFHTAVLAQDVTIASAAGNDMVVGNDIAASSIAFSTASERAGNVVHVISDGSLWLVTLSLGNEAFTPTIA